MRRGTIAPSSTARNGAKRRCRVQISVALSRRCRQHLGAARPTTWCGTEVPQEVFACRQVPAPSAGSSRSSKLGTPAHLDLRRLPESRFWSASDDEPEKRARGDLTTSGFPEEEARQSVQGSRTRRTFGSLIMVSNPYVGTKSYRRLRRRGGGRGEAPWWFLVLRRAAADDARGVGP